MGKECVQLHLKTSDLTTHRIFSDIYIYIYTYFNCSWVDTLWQQYSTHLHTNCTQNTDNRTYITIKRKNFGSAMPRLCKLYPGVCLTSE
jgi:hypothetical protein